MRLPAIPHPGPLPQGERENGFGKKDEKVLFPFSHTRFPLPLRERGRVRA
jgi:hypothetical protein